MWIFVGVNDVILNLQGLFGVDCKNRCNCRNSEICDSVIGQCYCPYGIEKDLCKAGCPVGWF